MARDYSAAERLRDYVRQYVRKDGRHYRWGNGARLAEFMQIDPGWVSAYADDPPSRHADFDQALAICAFYQLRPLDFATTMPKSDTPPIDPAIAKALQDKTLRLDVLKFLKLEDWERETVLVAAAKLRRLRESSPGSNPADQAAGDEKPQKRGRTGSRGGGKRG
jgi:hypothetical protein